MLPDTQVFTSDGFWNKPEGAATISALLIGGGGGGGSGRKGEYGEPRLGGAGGAGGTTVRALRVPIAFFPDPTCPVFVGRGGKAGPGQVDADDGLSGDPGTPSAFGPLSAPGGMGGAGGTAISYFDPGLGTALNTDECAASMVVLDYGWGAPVVSDSLSRATERDFKEGLDSSAWVSVSYAASSTKVATTRRLAATNGGQGSAIDEKEGYYPPPMVPGIDVPGIPRVNPPSQPPTNSAGVNGTTFGGYYGIGGTGSSWMSDRESYPAGAGGSYGGGGGGGSGTTSPVDSGAGGAGADGVVVVWSFSA